VNKPEELIMNEKDKELLYQFYLAGIKREVEEPEIELKDIEFSLPEDAEFSFPEPKQYLSQLPGRIIMLETKDYQICCLILEEIEKNLYLAYKISPYTVFASEFDLVFRTDIGRYLLETDNYFYVTEKEIEEAIEMDFVETEDLENLKQELNKEHPLNTESNTDLNSPENKFRIMEHNITLELRCRQKNPVIWIPQWELQYKRQPEVYLPMAAADLGIAAFLLKIAETQDANVYFAENYTLHKDEAQNLVLTPDENIVNKTAELRCGDIVVYKGKLPHRIILANFIPLLPKQAQDFLDIKLKVI